MSKMILIEEATVTKALEALEAYKGFIDDAHILEGQWHWIFGADNAQAPLQEALAEQPAQDNTYGYAKGLAESLFKKHYAHEEHYASGRIVWEVSDTTIGLLTQIDNMVCTLVRPAEQSAREWVGLTDEEMEEILAEHTDDPYAVVYAANYKLKEKNT